MGASCSALPDTRIFIPGPQVVGQATTQVSGFASIMRVLSGLGCLGIWHNLG